MRRKLLSQLEAFKDPAFRKRVALFLALAGLVLIVLSFMQDLVYRKPVSLGPVQWAVIMAGAGFILAGIMVYFAVPLVAFVRHTCRQIAAFQEPTLLILILLLMLAYEPLKYDWQYFNAAYVEYRDTAAINAAYNLRQHLNIYSLENFPQHIYLYGILYPAFLALVLPLFEYPFQSAAFLNLVFLAALLVLAFRIIRSAGGSITTALLGVLLLADSSALIFFMTGFRPDIPGLYFALLGLWLVRRPYSSRRVVAAALLLIIAFHLKQYYLLALGAAGLYLFLSVSKRKGVIFVAASMLLLVTTVLVLDLFLELYIEFTVAHFLSIGASMDHLMGQIDFFVMFFWPVLLLFMFFTLYGLVTAALGHRSSDWIDLRHPDQPLLATSAQPNAFDLAFLLGSLVVYFSMGRNDGAVYVYFGELILPFLLLAVLPRLDRPPMTAWMKTMVVLVILYVMIPFHGSYKTDFGEKNARFQQIESLAQRCSNILDHTPVAGPAKFRFNDMPIHESGHTVFGPTLIPPQGSIAALISSVDPDAIRARLDSWRAWQEDQVSQRTFDCIIAEGDRQIDGYQILGIVEFHDRSVTVYKRK